MNFVICPAFANELLLHLISITELHVRDLRYAFVHCVFEDLQARRI